MKIAGLEIYMDDFCVWEGNVAIFLPFLKIRRYELIEVTSTKTDGGIRHNSRLKYKIKSSFSPVDVLLERASAETRLKRDNEKKLNNLDYNLTTSNECLTY